jgi:V/A-type H+/Na+-transporting ATPase subunit C
MSPNPATDFAAINTRVRAMYSTLLTKQDFVAMTEANDLDTLFGLLKHTVYGPYLERIKDKELNARRAAFLVRSRLAEAYHSIINNSPEYTRPLLMQMYRYYEINNLKAVLRGITTASTWDKVRFVLFPYGSDNVLPAQAMVESGNVIQAVEMLKGTPYYETLAFAMKRFNVEQNLFPIEVALDLDYWRELWKAVKELPKSDQQYASRILGPLLDMNNLMWAIRYRAYHDLSEEEVINYTLPFGYHVRDEDIRAIAAGAEMAPIVKRLYPFLTGVDDLLADLHSGLPRLELLLDKRIADQCNACFVGNPFQLGIPIGFLQLCDFEIQELVVLFEAKANRLPVEKYRNYLLIDL